MWTLLASITAEIEAFMLGALLAGEIYLVSRGKHFRGKKKRKQ